MRKTLAATALLLLLAAGVVVNSLLPSPHAKAREVVGEKNVISTGFKYQSVYYLSGHGPAVVLTASLGREASDFNELVIKLNNAGYRTLTVEHPGIEQKHIPSSSVFSHSKLIRIALHHDANITNDPQYILIGHAYGNRLMRATSFMNVEGHEILLSEGQVEEAKLISTVVPKGVILLAAGGQTPMLPRAEHSLKNIFNPLRTYRSRMKDVEYAFFAEGNEVPDYWKRGWHTKTAMAQAEAVANSADDESWHCAGGVPILIVQPMQDRIAPIENAYALKETCPQEVEIVEVQNAGHALLPEQPEAVAKAVLVFLAKHHPTDKNK